MAASAATMLLMLLPEATWSATPTPIKYKSACPEICGVAIEGKAQDDEEAADKMNQDEEEDDSVRIVNGWSARPRPWMALVRAVDELDPEDYDTCGGAVVNSRYVLTAGHCVCMRWSARTPCAPGGELEYDPRARLRVYVGLNDARVEEELRRARAEHERRAEAVVAHPGWTGDGLTMPDLALIRIEGTLTFSRDGRNAVSPICLPSPGILLPLHSRSGYVSGWGLTRNAECFTDNSGPERHARCRFPFLFNGLHMDSCVRAETPSAQNRKCLEFATAMPPSSQPRAPGAAVMVEYGPRGRRRRTICYRRSAGAAGWCGTCLRGAAPGEYGHCADGMPPPEDDDLVTRVRPSRHWGFCSDLCRRQEMAAHRLMETRLTILPEPDCAAFNTSQLSYRAGTEFCAGHKLPYPDVDIYKRFRVRKANRASNGGNGGKYIFKFRRKRKNSLGAEKRHFLLGYYLGQTDSCQGDSGGPFYVFHDGSAFVVGVVSRGGQCAGFNQPGVYTNLTHPQWNQWVRDNIRDGDCNSINSSTKSNTSTMF